MIQNNYICLVLISFSTVIACLTLLQMVLKIFFCLQYFSSLFEPKVLQLLNNLDVTQIHFASTYLTKWTTTKVFTFLQHIFKSKLNFRFYWKLTKCYAATRRHLQRSLWATCYLLYPTVWDLWSSYLQLFKWCIYAYLALKHF